MNYTVISIVNCTVNCIVNCYIVCTLICHILRPCDKMCTSGFATCKFLVKLCNYRNIWEMVQTIRISCRPLDYISFILILHFPGEHFPKYGWQRARRMARCTPSRSSTRRRCEARRTRWKTKSGSLKGKLLATCILISSS